MQMCHWLCTRVPVKEQLIVKDTLWSFPVNKHVALSPLYVPLRPTCFSSSSVYSFSTFCWCFTVANCQSVRYCGVNRSVEMRVASPTSMLLDHEIETKQELALCCFFFFQINTQNPPHILCKKDRNIWHDPLQSISGLSNSCWNSWLQLTNLIMK